MFGRLSKWFKGSSAASNGMSASPFAAPTAQEAGSQPSTVASPPAEAFEEHESTTEPPITASGETIKISWNSIIKQVPAELLRGGNRSSSVRGSFFLSKDSAVQQLGRGAVKVPLKILRRAAPSGTFVDINGDKTEEQLISMPLKEILRRLRPEHYERRSDQQVVEVPENVSDLFGPRGQALSEVRILKKEDLRKSAPAAPQGSSTSFLRKSSRPDAKRPAAPTAPAAPPGPPSFQAPVPPAPPGTIAVPDALKEAMKGGSPSAHPVAPPAVGLPQAPSISAPLPSNLGQTPRPSTGSAPGVPQTGPSPTPRRSVPSHQTIEVPLAEIAPQWPEAVQQEIAHFQVQSGVCRIPMTEIAGAVKQGRVYYPWRKIRGWIQPEIATEYRSPQDDTVLVIPLQAVIPSFLKDKPAPEPRLAPAQAKAPGTEFPDVFKAPSPPAPSVPRPAPTPPVAPAPVPTLPAAPKIPAPKLEKPKAPALPKTPAAPAQPSQTTPPARPAGRPPQSELIAPTASAPTQKSQAAGPGTDAFSIPLATVSGKWPSQILKEIQRLNLHGADLEMPLEILEKDLKSGRIEHNWIQVCSWIKSVPGATDSTKHGDVRLEIPLSVVAPLYFKERQASSVKKSYVPSEIPDLFSSNAPAPEPDPEAAPEREEETQAQAQPAPASVPAESKPKKKLPSNIAELFGEPNKRNWTPNEIVHKTAELEGAAGALIALQDGLLVAACMPPEWKSETVAAFLPQMFGRLKQYARELNVGELKSLMITVEKGPLLVYNAGLIYFAVLGFNETPMPMPELTVIATELSRHTK